MQQAEPKGRRGLGAATPPSPQEDANRRDRRHGEHRCPSAADLMLVPPLQDNLPNAAIEAQCRGTPVVGFEIVGLPDIVAHEQTGYLAPAFDADALAHGIAWVLQDADRHAAMREASRERAQALFEPKGIAGMYRAVYALHTKRTWVAPDSSGNRKGRIIPAKGSRKIFRFFKNCFLKGGSPGRYERDRTPMLRAYL